MSAFEIVDLGKDVTILEANSNGAVLPFIPV